MTITKISGVLTLTLLALVQAGCASSPTPHLDEHFGEAVNAAIAQQTLNPEASQNMQPPDGVGGSAANHAVDRYHESFKEPPTTSNIFNIGVGSGGGGGGGGGM